LSECRKIARVKKFTPRSERLHFVAFNQTENILGSQTSVRFARPRQYQRILRIQSMMNNLCFIRIGIGRERRILHQDFENVIVGRFRTSPSSGGGDGEAVHADDPRSALPPTVVLPDRNVS